MALGTCSPIVAAEVPARGSTGPPGAPPFSQFALRERDAATVSAIAAGSQHRTMSSISQPIACSVSMPAMEPRALDAQLHQCVRRLLASGDKAIPDLALLVGH
jgi:hypothetical protein